MTLPAGLTTMPLPPACLVVLALLLPPAAAQDVAAPAQVTDQPPVVATSTAPHAAFTALLAETVRAGVVDYAGLAQRQERLDDYLATLGATDPATLSGNALKAFWINAYNAFTLKLMLEHLPGIESIKDIPAGQRWKAERWKVHDRAWSLDAIEHEILRPLGDPRIHFAIVCASRSCPDLASAAYEAETLDQQLDTATRGFLADTRKGLSYGTEEGFFFGVNQRLRLSALFDWFGEDFVKRSGSVTDFVLAYAPADAAAFIREHRAELSIRYLDYDWSLNDR